MTLFWTFLIYRLDHFGDISSAAIWFAAVYSTNLRLKYEKLHMTLKVSHNKVQEAKYLLFLQIFREPSKITSLFVTVWAFPRRSVKQSQTSRQQTNNYRETLSCPLFCQHGSVKWWIWDLWLYGVQLRTGLKKPFVNCLSRWIRNQFSNFERLSLRSQPVTLLVMDNFAMFRLGYGFLHKKKIQLRFRCL